MFGGKRTVVDGSIEPTTVEAEHWIASSPSSANNKPTFSPVATRTRNSPFPKRRSSRSRSLLCDDGSARPVSPTDMKFTSLATEEERTTRNARIPQSPHVLPFAQATLSPMSKSAMQRKLDRMTKQDKVAIAFDMEDFTDDKSSGSAAGSKDGTKGIGERIANFGETLNMPLAEPSDGEERRLTSIGAFLFKMCCLVVAFLVSGSFLYASKHYSEEHGIMSFMRNQDSMKTEVRQFAKSQFGLVRGGTSKVHQYLTSLTAARGPAAPVQMGSYAVLTNDMYSVDADVELVGVKKRATRAAAYSAATRPPTGPKHTIHQPPTVWKQTGVHAPLNPNFNIVSLRDPQQEAMDAQIQDGVARVNAMVESMREQMTIRSANMAPLQCKLISAAKTDELADVPSCDTVKLLLDPLKSLVDTAKIEIIDSTTVDAPAVHIKQRTHAPPLAVKLLSAERMGLFVEVPLGEAAGMLQFDESGLRSSSKTEINV